MNEPKGKKTTIHHYLDLIRELIHLKRLDLTEDAVLSVPKHSA